MSDSMDTHDKQVQAVTRAVAKLLPALQGQGFTPEAIFEGAIKGGATVLLAGTDASAENVADILEEMSEAFRDLEPPSLTVVQ